MPSDEQFRSGPSWNDTYQEPSLSDPDDVREIDFARVLLDAIEGKRASVLEIGAGSGKFSFLLAAEGHDVVAADSNPDVLAALRRRAEHAPWDLTVEELDLLDIDVPDNRFDLVFNEGVVEHFLGCDRQQALNEMARVSSDRVLVFVPHAQSLWYMLVDKKLRSFLPEEEYPFTRNELDHMCERAGLSILDRGTAGRGNRQLWSLGEVDP